MGHVLSDESYDLGGRFAPRVAKAIVWVVFIVLFLGGSLYVLNSGMPRWQQAVSIADMFVLLCFQLLLASRHSRLFRRTRLGYACLLAQAVLGFAPVLLFQNQYSALPQFAMGSSLLILRPKWNWLGFAAGLAAIITVPFFIPKPDYSLFYHVAASTTAAVITGLIVYGLTSMASAVNAIQSARTEMAKMAVQAERLRFARDLHDLLGYSLSAVSLKSELTHRLVNKNQARAREELSQIIDISRQALADVRSVASGYRELSLADEARSARSVLAAAEVDVRMDIDVDPNDLPARIRTVLATMLREGVTNILRHSKAERCEVSMRKVDGQVVIDISNDGVPQTPEKPTPGSGTGIQNLSNRVFGLDGELTAGVGADGRYRLRAAIPTGRVDAVASEPAAT